MACLYEKQIKKLLDKAPFNLCRIYSREHNAWWRSGKAGYTVSFFSAGIYTVQEAYNITTHCGPEKKIEIQPIRASKRKYGWVNDNKARFIGAGCRLRTAINDGQFFHLYP